MKTITFSIILFLLFTFQATGQINPVLNLTWEQSYVSPYNYFELAWEEPETPHDELIGYNVYREDELYRFQTETVLNDSNCDIDFLIYENGEPFYAHVTAVYNPGPVESEYTETVYVQGAAIGITDYTTPKTVLYPNPSEGKITISFNTPLSEALEMTVFDVLGKMVYKTSLNSENTTLDLGFLQPGIYQGVFKSDGKQMVKKIVLE